MTEFKNEPVGAANEIDFNYNVVESQVWELNHEFHEDFEDKNEAINYHMSIKDDCTEVSVHAKRETRFYSTDDGQELIEKRIP